MCVVYVNMYVVEAHECISMCLGKPKVDMRNHPCFPSLFFNTGSLSHTYLPVCPIICSVFAFCGWNDQRTATPTQHLFRFWGSKLQSIGFYIAPSPLPTSRTLLPPTLPVVTPASSLLSSATSLLFENYPRYPFGSFPFFSWSLCSNDIPASRRQLVPTACGGSHL